MTTPQPKGEIPMSQEDLDAIMAELEAETAGAVPAVQVAAPVVAAAPVAAPAATPAPAAVIASADLPDAGVHTATGVPEFKEGMKPIEPPPWEDTTPSTAPPLVTEGPLAAAAARRAAAKAANGTPAETVATPAPAPVATPAPSPAPVKLQVVASNPPAPVAAPVVAPAPTQAPVAAPAQDVPQQAKGARVLDQFGIDAQQFRNETMVTEANLDNCMMEQSSLRAYWSTVAANAKAQADRAKAEFEVGEARLFDHHRKTLAASGEKVTEKMIETAVKGDPRWFKLKDRQISAESIAAVAKGLVSSLEDRRDMIIQIGADRREGMKGQVRTLQTVRG